MTYNNFSKLNPNAKIFEELEKNPVWWTILKEDKDLFLDIRKDKCLNVCYKGNSITKITYTKDFKASIYKKYIDGRFFSKGPFTELDVNLLTKAALTEIKSRMDAQNSTSEKSDRAKSEREMTSELFFATPHYIDTEFEYSKDPEMGKVVLDITEFSKGIINIITVKDISNTCFNIESLEITGEMARLTSFIAKYEEELRIHYKNLIDTQAKLGLLNLENDDFDLNLTPQLIVCKNDASDERIETVTELLTGLKTAFEIR